VQEEGSAGQGAGAGEEGAQVPVQGRRDHAAAEMPRRPLLSHGNYAMPRLFFFFLDQQGSPPAPFFIEKGSQVLQSKTHTQAKIINRHFAGEIGCHPNQSPKYQQTWNKI
jgi:hypothetical protein